MPAAKMQSFILVDLPNLRGESNESKGVFPTVVTTHTEEQCKKGRVQMMKGQMNYTISQSETEHYQCHKEFDIS